MLNLENKIVVITGGTRGIGLEVVKSFAKEKAKVILFGSKKESVDKALATLNEEGLKVEGYFPNLNNYEEIEEVIKKVITKYGQIDVLINNAGISANKKIEDTTSEDFESIMDLNVNAMFNVTKAVVP